MFMVCDDLFFYGQLFPKAANVTVPQRESDVSWAQARNEVWGLQLESQ